ncbi:unnamed protein product [Rhizophagus irregularis]|nr:unnamed protein product [Rhizophagus irregularis]
MERERLIELGTLAQNEEIEECNQQLESRKQNCYSAFHPMTISNLSDKAVETVISSKKGQYNGHECRLIALRDKVAAGEASPVTTHPTRVIIPFLKYYYF